MEKSPLFTNVHFATITAGGTGKYPLTVNMSVTIKKKRQQSNEKTSTKCRNVSSHLSASLVVDYWYWHNAILARNSQLRQVATDVSHVVVDANASQDNLTTLEKIKKTLASEQDTVARTNQIVAESKKLRVPRSDCDRS